MFDAVEKGKQAFIKARETYLEVIAEQDIEIYEESLNCMEG